MINGGLVIGRLGNTEPLLDNSVGVLGIIGPR